ncbi:hypothetical protein BDW62DRAFT_81218 [Aspergillus aurantiobrunneus]
MASDVKSWRGVLYKCLLDTADFSTQLFNPVPLNMDNEHKLVGNTGGDDIQRALDQISDFKRNQCHSTTITRILRSSVLDDWAGKEFDRKLRNGYVHGGDVQSNIDLISRVDTESKVFKTWTTVFRKAYGISFETCVARGYLRCVDKRIIEILNLHAATLVLHLWTSKDNLCYGKEIRSYCVRVMDD